MWPKIIALVSYVALLGWMAYFIIGGLPLLILKHQTPVDARFVRGFFDVHYLVLITIALIGMLSSALSSRVIMAGAIGTIGVTAFTARALILSRMDRLRHSVEILDKAARERFRKLQITGIALTCCFFAVFFTAISLSSSDIVSCRPNPPDCQGEACRVLCSLV